MNKLRALSRSLGFSFALLGLAPAASAQMSINDAAAALVKEGDLALARRKPVDALRAYNAAMKADPASSLPPSMVANALLVQAGAQSDAAQQATLRSQSEHFARLALGLEPRNPVALEVMRMLGDHTPVTLHEPTPEAAALKAEGEVLFVDGKYDEAREKYLGAAQADPLFSTAWILAGDCYFAQKKWSEAEALFRKGVTVEPFNSQGWRFLSDALAWQGKRAAAEEALFGGIAAQPSQSPNWGKLAHMREKAGTPLTPFGLFRKASARIDPATGEKTLMLDPSLRDPEARKKPDGAVWMMAGLSEANILVKDRENKATTAPFAIELAAWRDALKVADELAANGGGTITDPGLVALQQLARADQLEAGLLILRYKESYRPEFEAWKKEHPNGIRKFVDTWGLQP